MLFHNHCSPCTDRLSSTSESTFAPLSQCPPAVAQQYQQRRFPMRDVPLAEQHQLARRLMAMLWATHCANGMHRAAYSLETPPRVLAEANKHLGDMHALRGYLAFHVTPL